MGGTRRTWWWRRPIVQGAILAALALVNVVGNTDLTAPPRYDGAGYAVLARSLAAGRGYREIDHPEAPRHAHFPPGYPLVLAMVGGAVTPAHVLSVVCTLGAVLATWWWFRAMFRPDVAWLLAMALAVNWRWGRDGGLIRSEPLFLLLTALALLMAVNLRRHGGVGRAVGLGVVLGASILVRHVGIALALAIGLDLILIRGRRREALITGLAAVLVVLPWVVWLLRVGRETQVGLLPRGGWLGLIAEQALFYIRRIPDQLTGPVVEVGTVFRPALRVPMTLWAALATAVVLAGWVACLRVPRRRLAGLLPLVTLAILLIWPFTEAGRFLIPLVPLVLIGAVEGLARPPAMLGLGLRHPRAWAAGALVLISIPYAAYAIATDRAGAERRTQGDFDAACAWIVQHGSRRGAVLTRHPGEVFLQTGRPALPPPEEGEGEGEDLEVITGLIARHDVAYLLVDGRRYANAPADPLAVWAAAHADRVTLVRGAPGGVAVFAVQGAAGVSRAGGRAAVPRWETRGFGLPGMPGWGISSR